MQFVLKKRYTERGYKDLKAFSEGSGISYRTLQDAEKRGNARLSTLTKIAAHLEIRIDDLFESDEPVESHHKPFLETDMSDFEALLNTAKNLADCGDTSNAIGYLQNILCVCITYVPAHFLCARLLYDAAKNSEAILHYHAGMLHASMDDFELVHTALPAFLDLCVRYKAVAFADSAFEAITSRCYFPKLLIPFSGYYHSIGEHEKGNVCLKEVENAQKS